jgi:hypothetical protein
MNSVQIRCRCSFKATFELYRPDRSIALGSLGLTAPTREISGVGQEKSFKRIDRLLHTGHWIGGSVPIPAH